jgi:hypothetical protein
LDDRIDNEINSILNAVEAGRYSAKIARLICDFFYLCTKFNTVDYWHHQSLVLNLTNRTAAPFCKQQSAIIISAVFN